MKTIIETATEAGKFTTLLTALKAAKMTDTLDGAGPFTVFAPSDEAFKKLPAGAVDQLLKDAGQLKSVLSYHAAAESNVTFPQRLRASGAATCLYLELPSILCCTWI